MTYDRPRRHQLLARDGVYELLQFLERKQQCGIAEVLDQFSVDKPRGEIDSILQLLEESWFIERMGHSIRITEDGTEAFLLLRVINGASLESIIDRLSRSTRSRYSLLTRDITATFFSILERTQSPKQILICSPWIRLNPPQLGILRDLRRKGARISAITRNPSLLKRSDVPKAWQVQVLSTLKLMLEARVIIMQNQRVHTKLFIVEAGYQSACIFGSENLTGAANIELGILIMDDGLINKLIGYWNDLFSQSSTVVVKDILE